MFKYSVKIKKTRGKIDESNKPNQTLTIKSKTRKNKNELFNEAADYLNKKYNLTLESADVHGGETIKVYVGTWGKYNGGSLHGEWVDLSNFATPEQFKNYCHKKLHADEPDAELMFQDVQGPAWVHSVISEYGMNYEMVWGWLALDDYEKPIVDGWIEMNGTRGYDDFDELVQDATDNYMGGEGQDFSDFVMDSFSDWYGHMSVREFLQKHYNYIDDDNVKLYMYNNDGLDDSDVSDDEIEEYVLMGYSTVQDLIDNSLIDWSRVERDWNIELTVASNGCVYH